MIQIDNPDLATGLMWGSGVVLLGWGLINLINQNIDPQTVGIMFSFSGGCFLCVPIIIEMIKKNQEKEKQDDTETKQE
jgi:hypothetical protein